MRQIFQLESTRTLRNHHGMVNNGRLLSFGAVEAPLRRSD
jgi:hypothetical protein